MSIQTYFHILNMEIQKIENTFYKYLDFYIKLM